jgi:hypothetical protein
VYSILVAQPEGMVSLGRPKVDWRNILKFIFKKRRGLNQ